MRIFGKAMLTLLNYRIDGVAAARVAVTVLTAAMVVPFYTLAIIYYANGGGWFAQGFEYEAELVVSIFVLWLILLPIHVVWAACATQLKMWERVLMISMIVGLAPYGMPVFLAFVYRRRAVQQRDAMSVTNVDDDRMDSNCAGLGKSQVQSVQWVKYNRLKAILIGTIIVCVIGYAGYRFYYGVLGNYSPATRALRASMISNDVWWLTERDLLNICESISNSSPGMPHKIIRMITERQGPDKGILVILVEQPDDNDGIGIPMVDSADGWETQGCGLWSSYPG